MTEWYETLSGLHSQLWQQLDRGVGDRHAPARQPTFATVSDTGWPEARTVVLRSAQKTGAVLEIYTDLHSDKIISLRAIPRAALHIWEPKLNLQIRLQADVTILTGRDVQTRWDSVPDHGRQSYGISPPPGTPITDALDYVKDPDPATFAVLLCQLTHIDLVHLGDNHRRARYDRASDWQGQWLAP